MSLNIFDGSFAFQRSLVDTDSVNGSKKTFEAANDRDTFKVSGRDDQRNTDRLEKNKDDFAAFLKSAQDDKNAREKPSEGKTDEASDSTTIQDNKLAVKDPRHSFATQKAAVELTAPSVLPLDSDVELAEVTALLENLSDELRAFIDDMISNTEQNSQNIVTSVITSSDESVPDVGGLLGLLVKLSGDEQTATPKGEELKVQDLVDFIQGLNQDDALRVVTGNLTPQSMSELQEKIVAYNQDNSPSKTSDEIEAFISQIVALIEPQTNRQQDKRAEDGTMEEAAALGAISNVPAEKTVVTTQQNQVQVPSPAPSRFDGRYDLPAQPTPANTGSGGAQSEGQGATQNAQNTAPSAQNNAGVLPPSAGEKFLQLLQSPTTASPLLDSITSPQQAGQALQSLPSSQAILTNVITQSPSAVQAHPATQLVSATIQKAVKAGEETNIKLRLDPPELGRVEVKMSIDKDNAARIVLTVEKPETFLMLQRDADSLQRAMSDAGLDMNGDLSFELASEDHDFDQSQQNKRPANDIGEEAELIEETILDVQIDPVTGHVRTDILV